MDKKTSGYLIIGLVLGFIVGALAVDKGVILNGTSTNSPSETATSTDSVSEEVGEGEEGGVVEENELPTAGVVVPGTNTVSVSNQKAGLSVALDSVTVSQQGWVAIHEDVNGNPGNILGATLAFVGERRNVNVDLLRATVAGKSYYAMLHSDDGDRAFDHKKDAPMKDSQGALIMVKFVAQ